MPAVTDRPVVGAYGDVYVAPAATAAPTVLDTPGTPWVKMGLVSEEGATWQLPEEETEEIKAWQTPYPVRILTTGLTTNVSFALMEWSADAIQFVLGGGTWDATATVVTYSPPEAGSSAEVALYLYIKDLPVELGIYYGTARVSTREEVTFAPGEAALLGVEVGIVSKTGAQPYQLLFDADSFDWGTVTPAVP